MGSHLSPGPLGLYIHIPWCITKCAYCNFFTLGYSRSAFGEYLNILQKEKELYSDVLLRKLSTVYFGGGTPSLLNAKQIDEILAGLEILPEAEITLEVNPIQITADFAQELKQSKVNRISLGIQAMNDDSLKWLTRKHKAEDVANKIHILQEAGFTNISGDYIYGLPYSSVEGIREDFGRFLALPLQHVSSYLLEIDPAGPLGFEIPNLPDDEVLASQYEAICKMLSDAGFQQYEISNFARPGYHSRHNMLYWQQEDYLALGASASGCINGVKYNNPHNLAKYYQNVTQGLRWPENDQGKYQIQDYIMMGLRLREGISKDRFLERYQIDFTYGREEKIAYLKGLDLLIEDEDTIRVSERALFISNQVIGELL